MKTLLTLQPRTKKTSCIWKFYNLLIILAAILMFNSCKKDILIPDKRVKPRSSVEATTISYSSFLKSVNINSLGLLKTTLEKQRTGSGLLTLDEQNSLDLALYADSVQKFTDSAGTSYVFKMKLPSRRAISFRNLTVYIAKGGKTSAFIATYTPSKQWIKDKKAKKKTAFEGDISFSQINLNGLNLLQGLSNAKSSNSSGKIMGRGNSIMYLQQQCIEYTVYEWVAYGCSDGGHLPGDMTCNWANGTMGMHDGDYMGGWLYRGRLVVECEWVNVPDNYGGGSSGGSGGGGGGDGGTSPNPPEDYNPCDDEPPSQSSIKNKSGVGILNVPLPPCDEDPSAGAKGNLINNLSITDANMIAYLNSNSANALMLYNYLELHGWSGGDKEFVYWIIAYTAENQSENVNSLIVNRAAVYYTNAEMDGIINSMIDPVTGDGIELYLILKYKGSKLFELSRYSKAGNSVQAGSYTLTPHYSKNGTLLFYGAFRNSQNGIEYIVKPDNLNSFTSNVEFYTSAANLVYFTGVPNPATIQIMSGDRVDGLLNLWSSALRSADYWLYLANLYVFSLPNSVVKTRVISKLKTDVGSGYTFTQTAEAHLGDIVKKGANAGQLSRPYMNSPLTINEIMATGPGTVDATFAGGRNWLVPGTFRGSSGVWELGINPQTKVIYHFNFTQ